MKDKFVQFLFYLLYVLCAVGMALGMIYNQPVMFPFCMIMAVFGVVGEVEYFRPKWPIEGSDDYKKLVDKFRNSISEGRDKGMLIAQEKERLGK